MKQFCTSAVIITVVSLFATGCETAPASKTDRFRLNDDAMTAVTLAEQTDASLNEFLHRSSGYVVFPHVAKGGVGVGGSYGRGAVYAQDALIGYADITQATIGLQAGGEEFREIVVFESANDLERFKAGKLTLAANLSAVALKTGAAASAKYTDGVAVFAQPVAGLMLEAAVGGQQFTYQPK